MTREDGDFYMSNSSGPNLNRSNSSGSSSSKSSGDCHYTVGVGTTSYASPEQLHREYYDSSVRNVIISYVLSTFIFC